MDAEPRLSVPPTSITIPPKASMVGEPLVLTVAPFWMVSFFILTLVVIKGYLGRPPGIVTSLELFGTPDGVQLAAFVQTVLTFPFQVFGVAEAVAAPKNRMPASIISTTFIEVLIMRPLILPVSKIRFNYNIYELMAVS
jgi:hypothetical protein